MTDAKRGLPKNRGPLKITQNGMEWNKTLFFSSKVHAFGYVLTKLASVLRLDII